MLIIKPGKAGWEARTLPRCYAVPPSELKSLNGQVLSMVPGPRRNWVTQNANSFLYLRGPPTQNLSFVSSAIQAYATQNPWWGPNAKRKRYFASSEDPIIGWCSKFKCEVPMDAKTVLRRRTRGPASIKSIYDYGHKKHFRFVPRTWGPASIKNGRKNYFDWVLLWRKMSRALFSRLLGFRLVSFGT